MRRCSNRGRSVGLLVIPHWAVLLPRTSKRALSEHSCDPGCLRSAIFWRFSQGGWWRGLKILDGDFSAAFHLHWESLIFALISTL